MVGGGGSNDEDDTMGGGGNDMVELGTVAADALLVVFLVLAVPTMPTPLAADNDR